MHRFYPIKETRETFESSSKESACIVDVTGIPAGALSDCRRVVVDGWRLIGRSWVAGVASGRDTLSPTRQRNLAGANTTRLVSIHTHVCVWLAGACRCQSHREFCLAEGLEKTTLE
jgi:hypothetical protein